MQLNNLKIGARLGAGFGAVLLLMLCVVALSIFRFSQARVAFDDTAAFDEAVRAGARGFLLKAISPDTLVQALRDVVGGSTALRPLLTERMERAPVERAFAATPEPETLSPKELQVLRLVASGRSNTEIAALLGNSEGVIKNHCSAVFAKMGVRDRTQAVLRAIDLGWI